LVPMIARLQNLFEKIGRAPSASRITSRSVSGPADSMRSAIQRRRSGVQQVHEVCTDGGGRISGAGGVSIWAGKIEGPGILRVRESRADRCWLPDSPSGDKSIEDAFALGGRGTAIVCRVLPAWTLPGVQLRECFAVPWLLRPLSGDAKRFSWHGDRPSGQQQIIVPQNGEMGRRSDTVSCVADDGAGTPLF